ncbi:hypothetical protein J3R83DRAFT_9619 [Lanmaoa asiatica]|nr:hypothetical protein J3R83DRAFT_9619 [Lanmaoa asiatica]
MNRDFGSAEKDIEGAERKVRDLRSRVDSIDKEINSLEHGPWFKKPKIAELGVQRESLEASLKIAQGALDAAETVLKSANYVGEKSALDAARRSLDLAEQTGPTLVSDSQRALTSVDQLTQAAVNRATEALRAVQGGSEKIVFDGAKAALAVYKRTGDVVFENVNKAIADLVKSVEYVTFETATTALATAQGATKGLDAANNLLSEAEKGSVDVLNIGKAIIGAGAEALNITSVHLSASLGKSVGGAGLKADVKGVPLKKPFEISVDLDPSKVENFLTDIFQK